MGKLIRMLAVAVGVGWGAGPWMAQVPGKDAARANPLASSPSAVAAGQKLYGQHCAPCHGADRQGSRHAPALDAATTAATEGQLDWLLRNGLLRRGMPSWSHLSPQERWQIVAFLKTREECPFSFGVNFRKKGITMRLPLLCAGLLALLGLALAQAPTAADVHLRGGRFAPLSYQQMTPQQKAMIDHLLSGERHSTDGPFNVMLRSPEMGDLAQQLGAYVRFHSELPNKLKEMAILMTGRLWTAQFEWSAHHRAALRAGLEPPVIEAIAAGKHPGSMDADEQVIYNFVNELLYKRDVSDRAFHAAVDRFGERRVVNLIGLVGYYQLVSMLLDVDRYPLPEGAKPELQPLP